MYDDLARTQNPAPLEWLVVHALIPSILVTLALQAHPTVPGAPQLAAYPEYVMLVVEEPWVGGPVPDRFPLLISMPRAEYPAALVRGGIEGYVRLRALVDARGRVSRSSIVTLHATDSRFVVPAQKALSQAVFRPAQSAGARIGCWVTMTIVFRPPFRGYVVGIQSKERHATGI